MKPWLKEKCLVIENVGIGKFPEILSDDKGKNKEKEEIYPVGIVDFIFMASLFFMCFKIIWL